MEKFDVFISFKGIDLGRGFVSHLYHSLSKQHIRTFKDDDDNEDDVSRNEQALLLIEESKIAIPVISKNYTDSQWCLNELAKMLECKKKGSLVIVPVFYEVDPVDFLHDEKTYTLVRDRFNRKEFRGKWEWDSAMVGLTRVYKAFANGVREDAEMIDKVMDYITGHLRPTRPRQLRMRRDSEMTVPAVPPSWKDLSIIKLISMAIQGNQRREEKLMSVKTRLMERCITAKDSVPVLSRLDRYVGMDRKMEEVETLLELDSKDGVFEIGIWGMGGSGKTSLARCVYEQISSQFQDSCYYLVTETNSKISSSPTCLLEEITRASLIKSMLQSNVTRNCDVVKAKLGHRKVLLVVDGMDCIDQVKHITLVARLFGPGSRLILVTRKKNLLVECGVKHLYEVESLTHDEALQLFSQFAFKQKDIPRAFNQISLRALVITGRLPHAIKVLGSLLQGREIKECEYELFKLEESRDKSFAQVSSRIKYPPKLNRYGREEVRDKFPSYRLV